jgi:hypothetical protein
MMDKIDSSFKVLAKGPPATNEQLSALTRHFGNTPKEYVAFVFEATEIELQHRNGQYVRIWGPAGCVTMDQGYGIRQRIPSAIPIGDDGGGHVIFYANGKRGSGLYHVSYGNLDVDDAIWIAPSLVELIGKATGIDSF